MSIHANTTSKSRQISIWAWLAWGLATGIFFTEYLIRVSPSAMLSELLLEFHTNSVEISTLSAFFIFGYVAMQLPVGMLVDRYGPKLTLSLSAIACAAATVLFANTESLLIAQLARLLMGFLAAFAFVGTLKMAAMWFNANTFSILVGATQALGMVGAACGAGIMGQAVITFGWRHSLTVAAGLLFVIATLILIIKLPKATKTCASTAQQSNILEGIKSVLNNPQTWLISIIGGLLFLPTGVFAEFWGSLFLQTTSHLSATAANYAISLMFIGWGIGGPLSGYLANLFGRVAIMRLSALSGIFILLPLIYLNLSPTAAYLLTTLLGLSSSGLVACYTAAAEKHKGEHSGVALAFSNGMSVIVAGLLQPVVGKILELLGGGHEALDSAAQVLYAPWEFRIAMSVLLLGNIIALLMAWFVRETHQPLVQKKLDLKTVNQSA